MRRSIKQSTLRVAPRPIHRAFEGLELPAAKVARAVLRGRGGSDVALLPENNLIEQDHRFIKRRVNAGLGFSSFNTTRRTISEHEAMNIIRKGQIEGIRWGDIQGQVKFVAQLFEMTA